MLSLKNPNVSARRVMFTGRKQNPVLESIHQDLVVNLNSSLEEKEVGDSVQKILVLKLIYSFLPKKLLVSESAIRSATKAHVLRVSW